MKFILPQKQHLLRVMRPAFIFFFRFPFATNMLLPNMKLKVPECEPHIALDHAQGELCFVSHAHSDHTSAVRSLKPLFATEETLHLANAKTAHPIPKNISLLGAGHMLGAAQLFARLDGQSLTYTGDFKLSPSLTCKGAQIKECDTLVMESTYGSPSMRFPSREEVLSHMEKWVNANSSKNAIIFGAYTMGKAQEIVKFLNDFCGITPIVSSRIDSICAKYEELGVRLLRVRSGTEESNEMAKSPFVAVMPSRSVNLQFGSSLSGALNMNVLTALASGWAHSFRLPVDRAFPLSDHADFSEMLQYIDSASPKKIVCALGRGEEMAMHLKKLGYNAIADSQIGERIAMQATLK